MNHSDAIQTAKAAADNPIMMESGAQVARAAKIWRRSSLLGLDTEFVRERTYFANLGLVQISDGQTVWLLDPLAKDTLPPLKELLEDPAITKIFHSPSEDLEVLLHVTGALPEPMVDTQLACALLGQPVQMGYHKAVEWLTGVEVDKELTRSNWCARPLNDALLRYAALDVCLLPLMWRELQRRLQEAGRMEWFEEDSARQLISARTPLAAEATWKRIKGIGRLDGQSLAILQALAAWRETEARNKNRPRGFIIKDNVLLAIAREKITDTEELREFEDLHPRARKRYGQLLVSEVDRIVATDLILTEIRQATGPERARLKNMRNAVSSTADELALEPSLLASRKDLEQVLFANNSSDFPEKLLGWRKNVVTDNLPE